MLVHDMPEYRTCNERSDRNSQWWKGINEGMKKTKKEKLKKTKPKWNFVKEKANYYYNSQWCWPVHAVYSVFSSHILTIVTVTKVKEFMMCYIWLLCYWYPLHNICIEHFDWWNSLIIIRSRFYLIFGECGVQWILWVSNLNGDQLRRTYSVSDEARTNLDSIRINNNNNTIFT